MDVLIFVFAVGIVIIGGLYAWTFTKQEKNGWKTCKKTRKRDMDAGESTLSLLVSTQRFAIL